MGFEPVVVSIPAFSYGSVTLVGILQEKGPRRHGNCFQLTYKEKWRHVLNVRYEDYDEICRRDGLREVLVRPVLRGKFLLVVDPKIPKTWRVDHACGVCCGLRADEYTWRWRNEFGEPESEAKEAVR